MSEYNPQKTFACLSDPLAFPLMTAGMIDTDMTSMSVTETTLQVLLNLLWNEDSEGPYATRHRRQPVSDIPQHDEAGNIVPNTNIFEKAVPCLYLYGRAKS
jgi:hypothetical protein